MDQSQIKMLQYSTYYLLLGDQHRERHFPKKTLLIVSRATEMRWKGKRPRPDHVQRFHPISLLKAPLMAKGRSANLQKGLCLGYPNQHAPRRRGTAAPTPPPPPPTPASTPLPPSLASRVELIILSVPSIYTLCSVQRPR